MLGVCFATLVVFAAVSPRSYGQESPKSSPDPAPVLAALNRVRKDAPQVAIMPGHDKAQMQALLDKGVFVVGFK